MTSNTPGQPQRSRSLKTQLVAWMALCDDTAVRIYGPYPPSHGRTRWRLQVYDPTTQRKLSVTAATKADAIKLHAQLEEEIKSAKPVTVYEVLEDFIDYKRNTIQKDSQVQEIGKKLKQLIPDGPLQAITPAKAESYYLAETRRVGKFGVIKAATHQMRLRLAKEFFAWLVRRGIAGSNPFMAVEPIGRANTGKIQPRESEAKALDTYLFRAA